jgi:hypothetical protein
MAGCILLNCAVAALSGLFFVENVLLGGGFIVAGALAPGTAGIFGLRTGVMAVAVLVLVLIGWLWRPSELGWWDSPLTTRVSWIAHTRTGHDVAISTGLMSPFDREFGRMIGYYTVDEVFLTYSLGPIIDSRVRHRLARTNVSREDVQSLKDEYGVKFWRPGYGDAHQAYLAQFFTALNSGVRKNPLPGFLRHLRAPASHSYCAGPVAYRREAHGPVSSVSIVVTETLFDFDRGRWDFLAESTLSSVVVGPDS